MSSDSSMREHGLNDGPRDYMILRPIPQKVYVFRFLYAVNLNFQLLTSKLVCLKNNLTSSENNLVLYSRNIEQQ